ncbi:MAG: hypothetical protein JXD22_09120 [Sedimentisphaerales bacterium]|nr:hypothetical protein [Sedimentisphaerales bacterium]
MQEPTGINADFPCLFHLLFVVILFIVLPIAVYRFYRKERRYPSDKSFGKMVVVELAFILLSIVFFDSMMPLAKHAPDNSLKAFGVEAIVLLWFVLPFGILWWRTIRIRKAKKGEGGSQLNN